MTAAELSASNYISIDVGSKLGDALSISQIDEKTSRNSGYEAESMPIDCLVAHHLRPGAVSQLALKRVIDVVGSGFALLLFLPLLLLIALLIKLDSRGPILFSQIRWGRDCKKIRVFKFRSMRADLGDATGVKQTVKNDPRVTRFGAFLRRTNIDELPQLINVLIGDMSLVGPRCHAIGMQAAGKLYEELVPQYHLRHQMRPGITGLAQMRGLRGPTDRPGKSRARIACDLFYVENFTVALDLKIIWGTVVKEIRGGSGF